MQMLIKLRSFIKSLESKEFYQYCAFFLVAIFLIFGLLLFVFKRKVNRYSAELIQINKERDLTRRILTDYKSVNQERAKVEEILSQNKNFILAKTYKEIIDKLGLTSNQLEDAKKSEGQVVGDKVEILLSASLSGISMKQLTDLLSEIANVDQIYPKSLVIKKSLNKPTVDVDLTIATLELTNISE